MLRATLESNARSQYGQRFAFETLRTSGDYQALPFMQYDSVAGFDAAFWQDKANFTSERLLAYFLTSGSSTEPKRIPVTSSLVRQKSAAFSVYWAAIYRDHPGLRRGNFIANFGDSGHYTRDAENVLETSETTFWNQRMQGFQDASRWPLGRNLTAVADSELRYYAAARLALQGELHCLMSLNPSTVVKFCSVLGDHAGALARGLTDGNWGNPELDGDSALPAKLVDRLRDNREAAARVAAIEGRGTAAWQLRDLWPELELIIAWQSELVEPYLRLLRRHADGVAFRDYITQSSECIIAIPVQDARSGGLLAYKSHFFEFIPEGEAENENPTVRRAWELEQNRHYEVVVTTGGGLYRYRTADCVRVDGFTRSIPQLSFRYRLGKTSSITGEKLTEQQVLAALQASESESPLERSDVLVYPRTGEQPHYAVLIPENSLRHPDDTQALVRWLERVETALARGNGEYRDKRSSLRLGPLEAIVLSDRGFRTVHGKLRRAHVGDDQYKPGVLRRERDLEEGVELLREVRAPR